MSTKTNISKNLKWYEHDGLLTYINELKYKDFIQNPDVHFQQAKILNLDIILQECRGDPLENSVKMYETIYKNDFKGYSKKEKNKAFSPALQSDRGDVHVERKVCLEHFKNL